VKARAMQTLKWQMANGIQYVRTHVDVSDPTLTALKAMLEVKQVWIHNNVVKAVRLGPVALSGGLWRDFQLGGGQVVTGFHTDGSW
ncbi:hypothetical protein MJN47_29080, partial [Salmonella enterica subsp. enterica serovar Lubbock]|nr:hypothetical protein [Salmonella enterica subsp. enterica serovar Lubbock]